MIKRVVCINSRYYIYITEGKVYDVVREGDTGYLIITDNHAKSWYEKECFKEIEYEKCEDDNDDSDKLETLHTDSYNELYNRYEQFKKDIIMKLCEDESRLDIIKFIMER
jgi:hypothetical protein